MSRQYLSRATARMHRTVVHRGYSALVPTTTIADVNWLLSALTQATAALIAIVGGLLVSRYVALHAEQQAAVRRVDDLRRRGLEAETREQTARRELDLYYVDDFLDADDIFETALARSFRPTVADALTAGDGEDTSLNQELLAIRLRELSDELEHAFRALDALVPAGKVHERWLDFKRQNNFEIAHRNAWEWMYEQLCESRRASARKAEEEATPYGKLFASTNPDILSSIGFSLDPPTLIA